jgi:hypothetical protein
MFHRTIACLIVALLASSGQSPVAAQPVAVQVSLVSVTPGTPSGDGDWCVGDAEVTVTAHVVDLATQSGEVTEGTLHWQFCASSSTLYPFPKEDCDAPGSTRWVANLFDYLSADSTPSLTFTPNWPVMGLRLQYRPAPGSPFKRATSAPFNIDTTCSP